MTASAGPVRRGYVDFRDGQLHYLSAGSGKPLVLIHQSPASAGQWAAVLPFLAGRGYHTVAFDLPGFGSSDKPPVKPDGIDYYAEAILEGATALGLERFDVAGHHTGSTVGLAMAAAHPDRVRRLTLWGIPMCDESVMQRLANETAWKADDLAGAVAAYLTNRARMSSDIFNGDMRMRSLIERLEAGIDANWAHNAVGSTDHDALVRRVQQPVLAICSAGDGIVWDGSKKAAVALSRGHYHDMPGTTLDVADEKPEELARVIDEFLSKPDDEV